MKPSSRKLPSIQNSATQGKSNPSRGARAGLVALWKRCNPSLLKTNKPTLCQMDDDGTNQFHNEMFSPRYHRHTQRVLFPAAFVWIRVSAVAGPRRPTGWSGIKTGILKRSCANKRTDQSRCGLHQCKRVVS